ncbi:hypothetical protein F4810DRAFT_667465 [Camillea tinctor]|nr:hypothetical protein F4810DRAFT_667465 [Camillea tinctor]
MDTKTQKEFQLAVEGDPVAQAISSVIEPCLNSLIDPNSDKVEEVTNTAVDCVKNLQILCDGSSTGLEPLKERPVTFFCHKLFGFIANQKLSDEQLPKLKGLIDRFKTELILYNRVRGGAESQVINWIDNALDEYKCHYYPQLAIFQEKWDDRTRPLEKREENILQSSGTWFYGQQGTNPGNIDDLPTSSQPNGFLDSNPYPVESFSQPNGFLDSNPYPVESFSQPNDFLDSNPYPIESFYNIWPFPDLTIQFDESFMGCGGEASNLEVASKTAMRDHSYLMRASGRIDKSRTLPLIPSDLIRISSLRQGPSQETSLILQAKDMKMEEVKMEEVKMDDVLKMDHGCNLMMGGDCLLRPWNAEQGCSCQQHLMGHGSNIVEASEFEAKPKAEDGVYNTLQESNEPVDAGKHSSTG